MDKPIGYVYETTCLLNGKTYIGLRHYHLDEGLPWTHYLGSGKLIRAAIAKYGPEQFSKRKLAEACSEESLQELEWKHIQLAKAEGKAEYNLFKGVGAGGDTFRRLTPERLGEVKRKQHEGLKRFRARTAEQRAKQFRDAYESFKEENQDAILKRYEELGTVKGLTNHFDASLTWLRKVLTENNIPVRSVNSLSSEERAKLQGNYDSTSLTLLSKPIRNGMTAIELHDHVLDRIDELQGLRSTLTRRQIEEHFDVSHEWLNVFLRDHKIPKKTDIVVDCSECRRCRLSASLASVSVTL